MQQQKRWTNHMVEPPIEKNTANHAVVNILAPRVTSTPKSCRVFLTLEAKTPYITVTTIVAVVTSIEESLIYQHVSSIFVQVSHTVQNMASGLLPFEKKTLRQAKTPDNVVATNPAIYKQTTLWENRR